MEQAKNERQVKPMLPPRAGAMPTPVRRSRGLHKGTLDGNLAAVRQSVRDFLVSELQAREVRVTKITPMPDGSDAWYAEAEMLTPALGVNALGVPLNQEVLEREQCAVELDAGLVVVSYEVLDPLER